MLISELSFPHLREAQDARLQQQLEQRRVAIERRAEGRSRSAGAHAGVAGGDSTKRMSRATRETNGPTVARPA
ncbi:MAG TPA: hypothetical protein VM430_01015 [Microbacterium sp.]|nr:hypothetical protein [Microbacterium sp.]